MVVGKECARCLLHNEKHEQHERAKSSYYSCSRCKTKKSLLHFSPGTIKNFLQKRKKNFFHATLKCFDCQYCQNRPLQAIGCRTGWIDGKYYCRQCRYPSCSGCGKERETICGRNLFKKWQCAECKTAKTAEPVQEDESLQHLQCPGCSRFI